MVRLPRLKDADEPFKNLSISNDLTTEERDLIKKQVEMAKNREEKENEGGKYIFRVRGPPWNLRIVRLEAKA